MPLRGSALPLHEDPQLAFAPGPFPPQEGENSLWDLPQALAAWPSPHTSRGRAGGREGRGLVCGGTSRERVQSCPFPLSLPAGAGASWETCPTPVPPACLCASPKASTETATPARQEASVRPPCPSPPQPCPGEKSRALADPEGPVGGGGAPLGAGWFFQPRYEMGMGSQHKCPNTGPPLWDGIGGDPSAPGLPRLERHDAGMCWLRATFFGTRRLGGKKAADPQATTATGHPGHCSQGGHGAPFRMG